MRKMDKELIDHIQNQLASHEEAYSDGAWERFTVQEEKKRRGFVYWPLWSAAAIILIIGATLYLQNLKPSPQVIVKNVNAISSDSGTASPQNQTEEPVDQNTTPLREQPGNAETADVSNQNRHQQPATDIGLDRMDKATIIANSSSTPTLLLNDNIYHNGPELGALISLNRIAPSQYPIAEIIPAKKTQPFKKNAFEQLLERDSYHNKLAKTDNVKSPEKWEPGIYVAPSMGNDNKVNMNYGFSLSYHVADKLSISSGISYAALSTMGTPSSAGNGVMSDAASISSAKNAAYSTSTSSKSLESVNASLTGINIPLELKYNISSKFYTGIGVSALAVLNNRQNNNYLVSSAQNTAVANTAGFVEQRMLIVTEQVSEQQTTSTLSADKYIGFYNFSLGYKQKIFQKTNFALEPFVRLPMKTFSKDNLNLTNGGLRLKVDF